MASELMEAIEQVFERSRIAAEEEAEAAGAEGSEPSWAYARGRAAAFEEARLVVQMLGGEERAP